MIKMGIKPKTLLYHKAFFKTLLLFKLRLGILPRVHLTAKLSLVCYTDFLFFLRLSTSGCFHALIIIHEKERKKCLCAD